MDFSSEVVDDLLCRCCGKPDSYTNLFYNINKELLKNLISLIQVEITNCDKLSKWLCRECAECVEAFITFRNKYFENINTSVTILETYPSTNIEEEQEDELFIIEALDEPFEAPIEDEEDEEEVLENLAQEAIEEIYVDIDSEVTTSKNSFECNVCSKSYRYLNSLNRHVKTAHELERLSCAICSAKFTQKPSLTEHMKNLHSDEQTSLNLKCDYESCGKTFNTAKMLHQHRKSHTSGVIIIKPAVISDKPKKKYRKQCTICGFFFKHIDEHILSHQAISTFQCDFCEKSFKFKTSLNVHRRIHTNERNFECSICNKRFRVSHHLKEHLTVHSKEKTFVCEILSCSKKFSSKLNLYKHSKLHLKKARK